MKKYGKEQDKILLEKVIRERRMRWFGHVTRTDEVRIPKQVLHCGISEIWQAKDELETKRRTSKEWD